MWRARALSLSFGLDRAARLLEVAREELAVRFLREQDWTELSRLLYARTTKYFAGSAHNESGLFEFERTAIERCFPPPPASILVGACGGGRELFALLDRGYRIAGAYDPVPSFVEALRRDPRLSQVQTRLCVGTHEALGSMQPIAELRPEQVDAVVIGWGSFTHLIGVEPRIAFLRSLRRLCPRAPVLLSFFADFGDEGARVAAVRATLRRHLGRPRSPVEPSDRLLRGIGLSHYFTRASFAAEADRAGYDVSAYEEHDFSYAYAVLTPRSEAHSR